ncbi:MAG: 3-methylcrotonyl-CoA carboxylase, partial [Rhodobacteraceae bacterium]|nr:3-methylcrotonyl-CoA carboxylase [Paracoccaceae bacterium]
PAGFLPATGTLSHLSFPEGARIDSGVRPGDTISPWYDPMIAKVITHGPTRAVALARLRAALEGTQVAGSVTNLAFLGALTRHAGFVAGAVDTGLIGRDIAGLTSEPAIDDATVALAALTAAGAGKGGVLEGFSLWSPLRQSVVLEHGEQSWTVTIARTAPVWTLRIGAREMEAERRGDAWWIDGARAPGAALAAGDTVSVFGARTVHFTRPDPLACDLDHGAGAGVVLAPMPGLVKAVFVAPGDAVEKGARLAILEAMKMEHTLTAGRDGTVAEVLAHAGQQVEAGAALIALADE